MEITKLPDDWDPSLKIKKESRRRFGICPICGETRDYTKELINKLENNKHITIDDVFGGYGVELINYFPGKGWYGPAKGDIIGWLLPNHWHYWNIDCYECHTCGAEWESDPYPNDIKGI